MTPYQLATDNLFTYVGDTNIEYGGTFVRVSDCRNYADIVEVIDASDAGIADEVWIQRATVPLDCAGKARIRSAFDCCGMTARQLATLPRAQRADEIARALYLYGYSDATGAPDEMTDDPDAILEHVGELLASI